MKASLETFGLQSTVDLETVWEQTYSAEVARAFVLEYRIMRLIIKEQQGNSSWLSHGRPHCNVRQDYQDTALGIVKHSNLQKTLLMGIT
jgi:hypothetical protein